MYLRVIKVKENETRGSKKKQKAKVKENNRRDRVQRNLLKHNFIPVGR